ncbi:MAG TPA: HAD family hydrolase [Armatimonadota bacterium]|nr:HAD family hydrolase [Armatimonadota bacterium]
MALLAQETAGVCRREAALSVEVIDSNVPRGRFRSALFDFDGTLSLVREGWQGVMVPMMVETLLETPRHESRERIEEIVTDFVTELTGEQTIYQMMRLAEEVERRGGQERDPVEYKREYLARLWDRIEGRVAALEGGRAAPEEFLVGGARGILEALKERGVELYLASGTDQDDVVREANSLGLTRYFGERIFGARERYWEFSKEKLIAQIVGEHGMEGPDLVTFGDGYVEIEQTKRVGGVAVGVVSDEARREGVDEWKRERLIRAGADVIVPDFREHRKLVSYLWGEVEEV